VSYTRVVETPIHHFFAELAAFPIASVDALHNPLIAMQPLLWSEASAGVADQGTARLWRDAERHLLRSSTAFSVEEIVALRDELWFNLAHDPAVVRGQTSAVRLVDYVRRLAARCLDIRHQCAAPRSPFRSRPGSRTEVDARETLARRDWKWLTFALPPDLLLAAHPEWIRLPARVDLMSPWLRARLRDQGFAQSHVHMKGDFDFAFLWARAADYISVANPPEAVGRSPGAELEDGADLGPWLLRAMIVRLLLAWHVMSRPRKTDFEAFVEGPIRDLFYDARRPTFLTVLLDALVDVRLGRLRSLALWADLKEVYRILREALQKLPGSVPKQLGDIYANDPLSKFFPAEGIDNPSPEMRFISVSMDYLQQHSEATQNEDGLYDQLFWQLMRVRNVVYRHVVQRPQTPGLQWFLRFYSRIRPLIGKLPTGLYVKSAAHFDGLDLGLRSLEVRTGLEEQPEAMLREIEKVQTAWSELLATSGEGAHPPGNAAKPHCCRPPEFGLVLHFIRDRRGGTLQGLPNRGWEQSIADPGKDGNSGYRYSCFYDECRRQALALGNVLRTKPETLLWVRGLDVCTDELGVPTWVLRPLLKYVRECAGQARDHLRHYFNVEAPPLRTTIHAGEDFVHLMTGLRSCEQTIYHFDLCEGDRIGHGLALGIDPRRWSAKSNRVPMPIDCRLRDLVWELTWYRSQGSEPQSGRWHWVEEEVFRLSAEVFGERIAWQTLSDAHELLIDETALSRDLGFPHGAFSRAAQRRDLAMAIAAQEGRSFQESADAATIAYRYLTDRQVFYRAQQIVWVDHTTETSVVEQLQNELRKRVCEGGLTIEVNPTSNLLIGDFHDLTHHPLWRLKPPRHVEGLSPVSLCLGSDDPLNFATTLPEEFQFVLDAAVLAGLSHDDAQEWLDEVRQTGLDARFTVPTPTLTTTFPVLLGAPPEPP
jgi:hypothetical protein